MGRSGTRVYHERDGNKSGKARIRARMAEEAFEDSETFAQEHLAAQSAINDIRKQRMYASLPK